MVLMLIVLNYEDQLLIHIPKDPLMFKIRDLSTFMSMMYIL
jgi:hypothetical protein